MGPSPARLAKAIWRFHEDQDKGEEPDDARRVGSAAQRTPSSDLIWEDVP
jgi:hypothetical protein